MKSDNWSYAIYLLGRRLHVNQPEGCPPIENTMQSDALIR